MQDRIMTEEQWRKSEEDRKKSIAQYSNDEYNRKERIKKDIKEILQDEEIVKIVKNLLK